MLIIYLWRSWLEVVKQDTSNLFQMITDSDDYDYGADGADGLARLSFLSEQISLIFASKMKYSP